MMKCANGIRTGITHRLFAFNYYSNAPHCLDSKLPSNFRTASLESKINQTSWQHTAKHNKLCDYGLWLSPQIGSLVNQRLINLNRNFEQNDKIQNLNFRSILNHLPYCNGLVWTCENPKMPKSKQNLAVKLWIIYELNNYYSWVR